jgi:hypothetical protein
MKKYQYFTAEGSCLSSGSDCSFSVQIYVKRYQLVSLGASVRVPLQVSQKVSFKIITTEPKAVSRAGYVGITSNGILYETTVVPFGPAGTSYSGSSVPIYPCQFDSTGTMYMTARNGVSNPANATLSLIDLDRT